MKVKELIDELQKLDPEKYVEIGYSEPINEYYNSDCESDLDHIKEKDNYVLLCTSGHS